MVGGVFCANSNSQWFCIADGICCIRNFALHCEHANGLVESTTGRSISDKHHIDTGSIHVLS